MLKRHETMQSPAEECPAKWSGREDFQTLYERYHRRTYAFFVHRGFSEEESHDLTQETFLQAYRSQESYRGEASFGTWLRAIAVNTANRFLRDQNREKRKGEELSLESLEEQRKLRLVENPLGASSAGSQPLAQALAGERTRLVRAAMDGLPRGMRDCLVLHMDQGLKHREIAALLDMSVGTVKSQLFAARAKLKEQLADDFGERL